MCSSLRNCSKIFDCPYCFLLVALLLAATSMDAVITLKHWKQAQYWPNNLDQIRVEGEKADPACQS